MAARSNQNMTNAQTETFRVVTGNVSRGMLGKFGAADDEVAPAAAGEQGFCVFLEDAVDGAMTTVVLLAGACIVPVKVGTGGATRGKHAVAVSNGFTDITPGGGTVAKYTNGVFMQTGVAGDFVGMIPLAVPTVTA